MHFSSRSETAGLACFRQASRSRWLSSGLLSGMMAGELGGLPSAGGPVWTIAGWALRGGFPPGPGRGIQAFSRRKPGRKESRGRTPAPLFYDPLVPTRWFWRLCRIVSVAGLLRCPSACPDLGSHFAGAGLGKKAASQTSGSRKGRNEMQSVFCTDTR